MFGFLHPKKKPRSSLSPRIIYAESSPAKTDAAQRSPLCESGRGSCDDPPLPADNAPNTGKADEKINAAVIAEEVGKALAPLFERQKRDLAAQVAQQMAENQSAVKDSIKAHAEKTEAELGKKLDKQVHVLLKQVEHQITGYTDRAVAAARKDAEGHWSSLKKELGESCSAMAQRVAQRPVIDRLVAMFDRIHDEDAFLVAWYRRSPDLALNLGSRQLQERYDEAVRSFAAEALMILRSLGVEQMQGGAGPFDPQRQRVVAVETTTRPELDGHVARIVRAGFLWNGTLYRPELVVVYKQEQKK